MVKEELVQIVSERTGFRKTPVKEIIEATVDAIIDSLSDGECVTIRGFGSFEIKKISQKVGRNPHTNEQVIIDEHYTPVFKIGKRLKDLRYEE